jgi:hypothetical protein
MPPPVNNELGILFLHHKRDRITRQNLASLRRHNPDAVLVTMSSTVPFPGGYALARTPELARRHETNPARGSDWLVCSWFLQHKESCAKWWIVEWDTYAEVSALEYYRPVWEFPFVAATVKSPQREPDWNWFDSMSSAPAAYRPFAMGAVPFLYLISYPALKAVCARISKLNVSFGNGELRFATVANRCGFPPCGFSPPKDKITWIKWPRLSGPPAIFHPVKHDVDYR